jgi:hypothetical protein
MAIEKHIPWRQTLSADTRVRSDKNLTGPGAPAEFLERLIP